MVEPRKFNTQTEVVVEFDVVDAMSASLRLVSLETVGVVVRRS